VANSTLLAERGVMGGGPWGIGFTELLEVAERSGRRTDVLVRQRLADVYVNSFVLALLRLRARTAANAGVPSAVASVLKLLNGAHLGRMANLAVDLLGEEGLLTGIDAPDQGDWARLVVRSFSCASPVVLRRSRNMSVLSEYLDCLGSQSRRESLQSAWGTSLVRSDAGTPLRQ
jgi:alkylation response protein AidB-like acyl-CoA dehydrogenase